MEVQNKNMLNNEQMQELTAAVYDRVKEALQKGKEIHDKQAMYDKLAALPAETERSYETTLVGFSVNWDDSILGGPLDELIDLVKTYPDPDSEQYKVAFAAFAVAVNHQRRMKNATAERALLDQYKDLYGSHVFYKHMDLLQRMGRVDNIKKAAELEALLLLARENAENLTNNVGGHHAYTETVDLAFEKKPDLMRILLQNGTPRKGRWHILSGEEGEIWIIISSLPAPSPMPSACPLLWNAQA